MSAPAAHLESPADFAARVGVHRRTIIRQIERGELTGVYRVGRQIRIDTSEALTSLRASEPVDRPNTAAQVEKRPAGRSPRHGSRTLAEYRAQSGGDAR